MESGLAPVFGVEVLFTSTAPHERLEFLQMPFVNTAWRRGVLFAESRSHAEHLAHPAGRALNSHGTEGDMGHANVTTGHHEIADIA